MSKQIKQEKNEWFFQWQSFYEDKNYVENNFELFKNWIYPASLDDFKGKTVLDCGCGKGQHLKFLLPYISKAVGVDVNTAEIASQYTSSDNIKVHCGDILTIDFP